ncbi:uncharacterized protein EI97DRAFT_290206 [Westerdykella ornata]|uniref:DUF6987 domain-containing protein n=1 Tax=Westerdykella ornata TaxID=318751 RepID=A0A6A6JMF4_WESOR|nr:uncharacterized protein EI97DRAFT_290206 [Westerdykella ornata]KAF2277405.1 hypothetical protein EI97DRAFT_290206 [Westerdykella ornata]
MPSPAAGKGETPRTPTKLGRKSQATPQKLGKTPKAQASEENPDLPPREAPKAEEAPKNVEDTKEKAQEGAEEATEKVSETGESLQEQEPQPIEEQKKDEEEEEGEGEDVEGGAEEEAEETADEGTQKAGEEGETAEGTEEETSETASKAADTGRQKGEGALSGARGLADRASSLAGKGKKAAEDAGEDAQKTAGEAGEGAEETAEEAAEEVKEGAEEGTGKVTESIEETAGEELPQAPDLSVLKGLETDEEGIIHDREGKPIGRLVEGDAEDLIGYEIGDDGEILDDDGDLVGRCELLPEAVQEQLEKAKAEKKMPDLSILKGLTADKTGQILNDDGDFVGRLVEGDPSEIQGMEFNERGEIVDDDGNVIARAELHPDVAEALGKGEEEEEEEGEEEAEEEGEQEEGGLAEGVTGKAAEAGEAVEGAEEVPGEIEEELPGVEALEGMEVNSKGEVLDEQGDVVGKLAEGDIGAVKGLTVNDKGEVVDSEGNVLGKVELAEGGAEKLKEAAAHALDIRILEGLKVNKKGKVLDEEGEEIGELKEGDVQKCAGKKINDKGEVLDKDGNIVGKVEIVSGEAAFEAMKALKERLEEEKPEVKEVEITPGLEILEGLKVNKKGQVLNEDGEPIGELAEGDVAECAGKKINDKGEVLDKDGNVIGKVKTLPQIIEQKVGEAEEAGEEAAEEAGEEVEEENLPPLSVLEGLTVNKAGKLIDDSGTIVGELIEGDPKKLSKMGVTCDAEGQFWDNKGHVIGRAKTVPVEVSEEEAPFAGLEGLIVVKDGFVEDENGNRVGKVVEGDAKKLVGRAVDEDGDILDKKGSVVGHAERYEEPEEEIEEPEAVDLSSLEGLTVNKQGNVIGSEGVPVARLVEGNPKELAGKKLDSQGQIWNDSGKVIGRVELIPPEERETKPEGPFSGLEGLRVIQDGQVADENDNIVGTVVEGNPKRLVGLAVDEDGDILDKYGNVKGHAEPIEEEEEIPEDLSVLDGLTLNKQGYLVDDKGIPIGRLVEGDPKELAGRKSDGEGLIHNDTGKVVGRCELIPENQRVTREEGPFAGLEGLRVVKDGFVEDAEGNRVGQITEGDAKRLVGLSVDEDGDIIDKYGNVKGHAERYEEEEPEEIDLSALAGCTVNKAGNVVNSSGTILGRVAEGDLKSMIGKKVDGKGQIWDDAGNVIGRAELVHGAPSGPEGAFAGFDNATVAKDGTVQMPDGTIVGRVIEGDLKKLVGHKVDEDGDITDKNGNTIGKAERWEPEEKERRINPMAGLRVNKDGEVRDQNGDLIGRLTAGDLGHCAGLEIDDNGYVVDNDGNKVGEVTLLENIVEEEEGETEEEKQKREDAELANKMANICQQTLERVQPICKQITEYIEQADRTPRDELDEEELVNNVKPLIEEAGRILQECNGSLRGLDPDGRIASQAKGRSQTREATPEEYRLADALKEITTTVVTTIDNAKRKIADMPHAKKKLNPLWALLTEPLFQIIAAVGLLLSGVLGLVGRLLNGLGLGGLVNGLLGGLGIEKLLGSLGLGSISEALGGKKEKRKGGGASGLPIVGGLLGGGK